MSDAVFTSKQLEAAGLVVVHKKDLKEILLEAQVESREDKRVKWIKKQEVKRLFGIGEWRLRIWKERIAAGDPTLLVKTKQLGGKTSATLWSKQSIEEELNK